MGAGDKAPSSATIDIFNPDTSSLELVKLTPSERFFSLATRVDIRSHEISGDFEWKLFVDLRAEQQWISCRMPPQKWLEATRLYNEQLNTKALEDHRQFVRTSGKPRIFLKALTALIDLKHILRKISEIRSLFLLKISR